MADGPTFAGTVQAGRPNVFISYSRDDIQFADQIEYVHDSFVVTLGLGQSGANYNFDELAPLGSN